MKIFLGLVLQIILLLGVVVEPIFAAAIEQENMRIRTLVGGDEEPPSTPANLQVTPLSTNEILISFDPATDNVAVSGYRIFRDELFIATTTLTSFNDTGLLPDTLYSYTVEAFDIFFNISSTSDAMATSTFPLPPEPPPPPPIIEDGLSRSSVSSLMLLPDTFSIVTDTTSARIQWQTGREAQYVVRWGRTTSYELGSVTGSLWQRQHETVITSLNSGTKYFYEVVAIDRAGNGFVIQSGTFSTKGLVPPAITPNVSQVRAVVNGSDVNLSWLNPPGDWSTVRVVRNHFFFPVNPQDGFLVYEGMGQNFVDEGALRERSPQFYTIFVVGSDGSVSSGAVVRVARVVATLDDSVPEVVIPDDTDPVELLPEEPLVEEGTRLTYAMDVFLVQDSIVTTLARPELLRSDLPIYLYIPIEAVPPHLKAIVLTLTNPSQQNETTSYLLKINPEGTRYEALVPAMTTTGESWFTIELYDFELSTIRTIRNKVTFGYEPLFEDISPFILFGIFGLVSFIGLWYLLTRFLWRRYSI